MKKNIPTYMLILSEDNFEVLEEIFERSYSKFIFLYWLICDYSDSIEEIKYKNKNKEYDILKIEITFAPKTNIKKIIEEINSSIEDEENVSVSIKRQKNIINIEISKAEAGLEILDEMYDIEA